MVPESEETTGITMPYERVAMNGGEMPNGLGYPDQVLFLELRMLYGQFKHGIISRETAIVDKKRLLDEYRMYQYREQMGEEWVEQIKLTELARAAYRKNRTLENADKLVEIIEGRNLEAIRRVLRDDGV